MAQRIFVKGRVFNGTDSALQDALASIYETPERPRCMCVQGGVDLYISKRASRFVLARMPGTGEKHHTTCPDFEPSASFSGRGALLGSAMVEKSPDTIEIQLGFPLSKGSGRTIPRGAGGEATEVEAPKRRMSLQALLHALYDQARFNRWYPAMAGVRSQGVLHKYLLEAANHLVVKGKSLESRLYVPEPFSVERKDEIAERRRKKLAFLNATDGASERPYGIVIGEFKEIQSGEIGLKLMLKHMPDTPLLIDTAVWQKVERLYRAHFEAREADVPHKPRILVAAVVGARRENVYQVERVTMMLVSHDYLPINSASELPLLTKLNAESRIFIKPLQYDAPHAAAFPSVLLLDASTERGGQVPLFITSSFDSEKDQEIKEKAIAAAGDHAWVWNTGEDIPRLPPQQLSASRPASHIQPTRIEEDQSGY